MKLTFSPALPEDRDTIFRLNKELIDRYEDVSSIDYDRVLKWVRSNIAVQLPHFRRVMADGHLAGYFCLIPSEDKWELDSLFVFPEFQGRGIGTFVLDYARKESGNRLFFFVFQKNTDAIRLYERMGFRIAKQIHGTRYIMA